MAEKFAEAKKRLMDGLKVLGWKMSSYQGRELKVPWAEDPESGARLWFQAQAVHYSTATAKGSLVSDMRGETVENLVRMLMDEVVREVMDR